MFWYSLIHNFAFVLHLDDTTAGIIFSMIITAALTLGVYILCRGTVSNTKTWDAVTIVISIVLFIYPISWIPLWIGMLMLLSLAMIVGYAFSKTARGGES